MFGAGQPLDAVKYLIIIPASLGDYNPAPSLGRRSHQGACKPRLLGMDCGSSPQ